MDFQTLTKKFAKKIFRGHSHMVWVIIWNFCWLIAHECYWTFMPFLLEFQFYYGKWIKIKYLLVLEDVSKYSGDIQQYLNKPNLQVILPVFILNKKIDPFPLQEFAGVTNTLKNMFFWCFSICFLWNLQKNSKKLYFSKIDLRWK